MIVFVGCGAAKRKRACKAEDMYTGTYFSHLKPTPFLNSYLFNLHI